ncbi:hypothetical protein K435DRAFT_817376 [Dendrothele bispora CBS 962.96]|uniref:CS domain-containing protein n=1 Tax=Dendrothele bispora (strain CBS 962.96) TaxID=1314807 RepID=A0A4S8MLW2_DENBC|nr:hypothetical protein K435DRAFT_817376 [Dendrothele bispora CBS 962.96]
MFRYSEYSWHQATVLLMVPSDTTEEDTSVVIERNYLIAGVRGQPPIVKGRLYGNVDTINSGWQLEPRASRISHRMRTTSTTSTTSTQSSYAIISDPEISSSFAASLESGQVSDAEDLSSPSPALSSPSLSSTDEARGFLFQPRARSNAASRPVSPGRAVVLNLRSLPPSFSSLESLGSIHESGRLLTLHLEKDSSAIWPSLISGPVPDSLAPCIYNSVIFDASHELEHRYNMDPTSLTLRALELFDVKKDREEAFECFLRAWHLAHSPTATMKLVTYYLPIHVSYNLSDMTSSTSSSQTQIRSPATRGTTAYYLQCIGGPSGLARLYFEAGMLYLEGTATNLVSCSHSSLSSIRMPLPLHLNDGTASGLGLGGTEAWRRDRIAAGRFFDRAKALQPDLDIPTLPPMMETETEGGEELEMPCIELSSGGVSARVAGVGMDTEPSRRRRRRNETTGKNESGMLNGTPSAKVQEGVDGTWYMLNMIPGLVGAGTALVVVGVVGVLGFSSWSRRNQGS